LQLTPFLNSLQASPVPSLNIVGSQASLQRRKWLSDHQPIIATGIRESKIGEVITQFTLLAGKRLRVYKIANDRKHSSSKGDLILLLIHEVRRQHDFKNGNLPSSYAGRPMRNPQCLKPGFFPGGRPATQDLTSSKKYPCIKKTIRSSKSHNQSSAFRTSKSITCTSRKVAKHHERKTSNTRPQQPYLPSKMSSYLPSHSSPLPIFLLIVSNHSILSFPGLIIRRTLPSAS
jgi:hypothetical protein